MRCDLFVTCRAQLQDRSRFKLIAGFAIFLLLIAVGGAGCNGDDAGPSESGGPAAIIVEGIEVRPERFVLQVALTGQLEAEASVVLSPEREGVVEAFLVAEGAQVEKGEIIVQLRNAAERALVRQAEAELRLAKDVYERTQLLSRRNISSQARQTEAAAKLDVERAKLERAKVELERRRIRAPFDGVLGNRLVAPGAGVDEKDGLISIEAIHRLQVLFTVPEANLALARQGAAVHIRVAAFPSERFPGEVFFISPNVDPATRRLIIKAWISNTDLRLKPGMFANVDIEIMEKDAAILLPESAIVYDRHGIYVWRVDDAMRVEKVPIKIGLRQTGRVEIVAGIRPGDQIITAGTNKVLAGKKVAFSNFTPAAATTAQSLEDESDGKSSVGTGGDS